MVPGVSFQLISLDLWTGKYLLVLIDDYLRYPIVKIVSSTAAKTCVPIITEIFATFGTPERLRSDNGPPFNGEEFKKFAKQLGFKHHRITPCWPRANGVCERFMKNLGKVLKNATLNGAKLEEELVRFLRSYRATPHASTKIAPNELMFKGKASTSMLPCYKPELANDDNAKAKMKSYTDARMKAKPSELKPGDYVLLRRPEGKLKATSVYDPEPFFIESMRGSRATIVRRSQRLHRNLAVLKWTQPPVQQPVKPVNRPEPTKSKPASRAVFQPHPIQPHPIQPHPIQPHPIQSHPIQPQPIQPQPFQQQQQPQQQVQQQQQQPVELLIQEPAEELQRQPEPVEPPQDDQEDVFDDIIVETEPVESTDASFQSIASGPSSEASDSADEYVLPRHVNLQPTTSTYDLRKDPKKRVQFDALYS